MNRRSFIKKTVGAAIAATVLNKTERNRPSSTQAEVSPWNISALPSERYMTFRGNKGLEVGQFAALGNDGLLLVATTQQEIVGVVVGNDNGVVTVQMAGEVNG